MKLSSWISRSVTIFVSPTLRLPFVALLFFFASCAVSLSPRFDQTIVDNLSKSSVETLQLFAATSNGTTSADFNKREEKYNDLIGKLEALSLKIQARPMPNVKLLDKIVAKANASLKSRDSLRNNTSGMGSFIAATKIAPSVTAINQIVKNLTKLRDTDKAQGVTKAEVTLFKNNVILYLDQALTYESFLNK